MASFKVPNLRIKLQKLYLSGRNPDIANDSQLASKLGISEAQIQNWGSGGCGMKPDAIPGKHVQFFCQLFNVERADLQLTDLQRFEERLTRPLSGWARLFQRTEAHNPRGKLALSSHRGIGIHHEAEDQDVEGECLQLSEHFRIRLEGPPAWYVTVLVQDPLGVDCLCPRHYPNNRLGDAVAISLPPEDRKPFFADQPTGAHWIVAAFTQNPLPETLHGQLTDSLITNREKALDELDRWLENTPQKQRFLLHQSFFIANPPEE